MIDLFDSRFRANRKKAKDVIHSVICNKLQGLSFSISVDPMVPIMPSKNPDNSVTDRFTIVIIRKQNIDSEGFIQTVEIAHTITIWANHKCFCGGYDLWEKGEVRWGFDTNAEHMEASPGSEGFSDTIANAVNEAVSKHFPVTYDLTEKEKDYARLWHEIEVERNLDNHKLKFSGLNLKGVKEYAEFTNEDSPIRVATWAISPPFETPYLGILTNRQEVVLLLTDENRQILEDAINWWPDPEGSENPD